AFLAVMAALLILCAAVSMPVMTVPLFGLRNMVTAVFYGAFATIALLKVRKPGSLCIVIIFNAVVLLMMSPVMFLNNTVAAIVTELIVMLLFRSYQKDIAVVLSAGLVIPLTLPISILFYKYLYGKTMEEILSGQPVYVVLCCAGTVLLSFLGVAIGMKIGKELKKAGKLK
ncbi:MAG: hypothetical protein LUE92_14970, partial [Clostridiales bacterium]|nr:hypothetical protein [Clostridiales bacterium]